MARKAELKSPLLVKTKDGFSIIGSFTAPGNLIIPSPAESLGNA